MYFPPEIMTKIFVYLPAKDLMHCRQVHPMWKAIIDGMSTNDSMWRRNCKDDFNPVYEVANRKAKPGLRWFSLYRSLTLWKLLNSAAEEQDEFAVASFSAQEIRNFKILDDGIIGVLKKGAIVYYDIETLGESHRSPMTGDYSKYTENKDVIVILSYNFHLFIIRKVISREHEDSAVTYDNVKMFTLVGNELYFVNRSDEIFICKLRSRRLFAGFMGKTEHGIMSIGYSEGTLNVLTFHREIWSFVQDRFLIRASLGSDSNLLNQLQKYNFLKYMDWKVYFQWIYVLNKSIPEGPLRDVIIIRPYGNVYFVGSNWGVLRIYYISPNSPGGFDIFNTPPMKQYNFMDKTDGPVNCMCPIMQVDVMEGYDGHTVIVAMPKKIVVLNFTHNFETEVSVEMQNAMLPQTGNSMQ